MSLVQAVLRGARRVRATVGFTPTPRLAYALAAVAPLFLLGGMRGGTGLAVSALLLVIVVLVVDVAALPQAGDFDVEREFPDTVGVGDRVEGRYVVRSQSPQPLMIRLFDAFPPKFFDVREEYDETAVPRRGLLEQPFSATAVARGEAPLGDVALRVHTRIGLASRTFRYPQADSVLIAPSLAGVKRFRWLAVHHRLATVGVRDARRRGEGRSFARLRDYVVGDDPRHIDWKATARRGHPITREFTVEQSQTVMVLVDAGRSMTQLAGRYPRFEYALSSVLLLADVALNAGDRVGALVFDDELRALVPAQRGVTAMHALRTALIPVQPTLVEPDYATAFRILAQRQRKRSLVVLVTDVIDARTARSLLAYLTRGATRHLVVVVALRNDALINATAIHGTRMAELYESAAAEELLSERLTALQRMRDAGVVVLDVAPEAMAAAVVNEYLELKTRGAI